MAYIVMAYIVMAYIVIARNLAQQIGRRTLALHASTHACTQRFECLPL